MDAKKLVAFRAELAKDIEAEQAEELRLSRDGSFDALQQARDRIVVLETCRASLSSIRLTGNTQEEPNGKPVGNQDGSN
jgi:hypothetical protein